ncbi:hypothetical protein QIS74_07223 [Colletotrichum tabaci]|uniref:Uncharacterized protein n=1 Tax=Colletotrichum tabaci TaxID=1209068 RepID=A0AAV9TEJ5_9PEZI
MTRPRIDNQEMAQRVLFDAFGSRRNDNRKREALNFINGLLGGSSGGGAHRRRSNNNNRNKRKDQPIAGETDEDKVKRLEAEVSRLKAEAEKHTKKAEELRKCAAEIENGGDDARRCSNTNDHNNSARADHGQTRSRHNASDESDEGRARTEVEKESGGIGDGEGSSGAEEQTKKAEELRKCAAEIENGGGDGGEMDK